jgi:hypothetical protein
MHGGLSACFFRMEAQNFINPQFGARLRGGPGASKDRFGKGAVANTGLSTLSSLTSHISTGAGK